MSYRIRKVAVLGAGTMGAAIAAHCANAGLEVDLLRAGPLVRPRVDPPVAIGIVARHPAHQQDLLQERRALVEARRRRRRAERG